MSARAPLPQGAGQRLATDQGTERSRPERAAGLAAGLLAAAIAVGCTKAGEGLTQQGRFVVVVTAVNGMTPPAPEAALPANIGDTEDRWSFTVQALDERGQPDPSFNGFVRLAAEPGAVNKVEGTGADGRNIRLTAGYAEGTAAVTSVFGASRLWVTDMGYVPASDLEVPTCANGVDDDDDVMVDFPNDPGCAFADDMSEEEGGYLIGVSAAVYYQRPSIADVQGRGSATPYSAVAMRLASDDPRYLVVTRVASDGFCVTDLSDAGLGWNHVFAYNFNTPEGMRVCDRITYLSGTASEFYGFTELSFPSYELHYLNAAGEVFGPADCRVPEPFLLDAATLGSAYEMEKHESGLVRIEDATISDFMGPEKAVLNAFGPNKSNCDLNDDGAVDYLDPLEGSCSNACADNPQCSEWTNYAGYGSYKVYSPAGVIRVSTATALGFDPLAHRGQRMAAISGTLRNFSGGPLNWTIETRCIDDLVCDVDPVCQPAPVPSNVACVTLRTQVDNDSATY